MQPRRLLLATCLAAAPALAFAANEWPTYRGPTADGHAAADARPPVRWSESENVRWKTPVHGKGWSSPVIWDNQVWMTTGTPDARERFVVCLDRETGKVLHDFKLFDDPNPQFHIEFNSAASPTPAIEAGRVYIHFGSTGTACLDTATAKTIWERRDLPCNHWRGAGSSPIIYKDLLIVAYDGYDLQYVLALDKHTGKTVWKTDRNFEYSKDDGDLKKAYSTARVITVNGRDELISPSAEATVAYDPLTGSELWRVIHGGMNSALRPVYGHGLVFLTTASGGKQLVAVRPGGRGDVTADHIAWNYLRQVPTRSSPILVDDILYFVHDRGALGAVEVKAGKEVKRDSDKPRLGTAFTASPIYAGGRLYFFDELGSGVVVKPGRDYAVEATNRLADGCMASPAAVGNALYVRTRTHVYRIEVPQGK